MGAGFYGNGFRPYVPQHRRKAQAARAMAKRSATAQDVQPVRVSARAIATTFWGRSWCDNLERYGDYANRLPRGRTYVRNGSVVHLGVDAGRVLAIVSGSELYEVDIRVAPIPKAAWSALCRDCTGGIDSLVELLRGQLSEGVMQRVCRPEGGLFPQPREIAFTCSCPDYASMCKHVAAVLYGVGARLDASPELLFTLRGASPEALVAQAAAAAVSPKARPGAKRRLADGEVADVFGVELAPADGAPGAKPARARKADGAPRKRVTSRGNRRAKAARGAGVRKPRTPRPS